MKKSIRKSGRKSNRKPITQEDRQLSISTTQYDSFYQDALTERNETRRISAQEKRSHVLNIFLKQIRPNLKVDHAYSLEELIGMYPDTHADFPGMFRYLLLNNSEFLNINHVKSIPTYIQVVGLPTITKEKYIEDFEATCQMARDFENSTGLRVIRPKRMPDYLVDSLIETATRYYDLDRPVKRSEMVCKHGSPISQAEFDGMIDLGTSIRTIRTYSAFWIDRQF